MYGRHTVHCFDRKSLFLIVFLATLISRENDRIPPSQAQIM
jgi:hypothetical protein